MRFQPRIKRSLVVLAAVAGLVLVPTAASTIVSYQSPLFGVSTADDGDLLVADAGQGIVKVHNGTKSLYTSLPGVTDVTPALGGPLYATVSTDEATSLYRIDRRGRPELLADLLAFEKANNPHPAAIDSNPFDVVDLKHGGALVADAGGNDLLDVGKFGQVRLAAVLPDELVSTANIKNLAGCPDGPPDFCDLPPMIPAEPVATSVAIGPDGSYYVGELKGFPAPLGESRIWRIQKGAQNVHCPSKQCTVALDGFTSVIDLAFGPDGRLYVAQIDDASWAAVEIFEGQGAVGGSVHACDLKTKVCTDVVSGIPILTSITFKHDASLWGSIWALVPELADVVQLAP